MEWKFVSQKFVSQKFAEETGRMVHTEAAEVERMGVLVKVTQSFYNVNKDMVSSSFSTEFIEGAILEEHRSGGNKYWKVVKNG